MPSVSQAQSRAMHAAAEGKTTLGIPKSVGEEFVEADAGKRALPKKKRPLTPAKRQAVAKALMGQ